MLLKKPRYRIDLSHLQAICEANYLRLLRLMPAMAVQDELRIVVDADDGQHQMLVMRVLERCRYTTTLQVRHERRHECWRLRAWKSASTTMPIWPR